MNNKALIIGSGLTGSTCARVLADSGWTVEIHESEYFVGGHVRTAEYNGILYEQNAIHVNHTNNDEVINFIKRFSKWIPYIHKIKTKIPAGLLSWPPQVNELRDLKEWVKIEKELKNLPKTPNTDNFEAYAISIMGSTLYDWFVFPYTKKQWGTEPKNLSSSFAPKRIDLRYDGYTPMFRDKWQGWPDGGWTKFIENMLNHNNISIKFGIFETEKTINWDLYDVVIVTSALDDFLNTEQLEWRGVRVEHQYIPNKIGFALEVGQINHPGLDKKYTRKTETKHMSNQKNVLGTIVTYEYPGSKQKHYPVDDVNNVNRKKANILKEKLLKMHPNAIVVGRLANYVYINTDQAINQALVVSKKIIEGKK
jgi:UDP-galactopyranose mutase